MITPGMRVISANGNPGTVQGYMTSDKSIVAIRLDSGRNIGCLASKCTRIMESRAFNCTRWVVPFIDEAHIPENREMPINIGYALTRDQIIEMGNAMPVIGGRVIFN